MCENVMISAAAVGNLKDDEKSLCAVVLGLHIVWKHLYTALSMTTLVDNWFTSSSM